MPDEIKSLENSLPKIYLRGVSLADMNFYEGKGCKECGGSGYRGRIAIHEVLEVTESLRRAIMTQATAATIRDIAILEGMIPIVQDGLVKAEQGITSIEEVLRVMHE